MKLLKILILPLLLLLGYLLIASYPYFFSKINAYNSLGVLSVVEEKSENVNKTGKSGKYLLQGEKITGEIQATENNFGILLFRFSQSGNSTDTVVFRIKEKGKKDWHYENTYKANQFQPNQYFTLGFPQVRNSKDRVYVFEIESLSGTPKNGVGISQKVPEVASVYTYARGDLMNLVTLSTFISKKFVYVVSNADYLQDWKIIVTFLLPLLVILSMQSKKNTRASIVKKQTLKNKKNFNPSGTVTKKRLAIGLLLFLIALLFRYAASIVDQSNLYPFYGTLGHGVDVNLFYSRLGNGGDYDQFIKAATCAVREFCPAILGQNFLIESSILGVFFEFFSFTGGLKAYLYLMIILSAIVATLPYVVLSRNNIFTIGGIIGSLFLASSDYLIHMSNNLPPDNLSLFLFSIFYVMYLLTMEIGTIRWLVLWGILATLDGLSKLVILINDIAVLLLFIPIFVYEKAKKHKMFPFVRFTPKLVLFSFVPFLVFLFLYSLWEVIVEINFGVPYYLRAFIEGTGSTYVSRTDVASDSITIFSQSIGDILLYYVGSAIVMQKRFIEYTGLNTLLLGPIFIGLFIYSFQKSHFSFKKLFSVVVFLTIVYILIVLFRNNTLLVQEIASFDRALTNEHYANVFIFSGILFLFFVNFKFSALKLILPILPYYLLLIVLAKNAPWGRMYAHIIVWSVILLCFLVDWMLRNGKKDYASKSVWIGSLILALFIGFYMIPKVSTMAGQLYSGFITTKEEVTYLRWVNAEVPENAIIIAGGKSDLVADSHNVKKPVIYNSLWTGAVLIKPNERIYAKEFTIVEHLKNENNFKKNRYFILEKDKYLWRARVSGVRDSLFSTSSAQLLITSDYIIKNYKYNADLGKGLYELKLKD